MQIDLTFANVISSGALALVIGAFRFIMNLTSRIAKLETGMEYFVKPLIDAAVKSIHSPTHFRKDELLEKLSRCANTMEPMELKELKSILEEEENGKPQELHMRYAILKGRIDWLLVSMGKGGKCK